MAMAYAPARLASGHVEPWLLLVQAGWLVALAAAAAAVVRPRRAPAAGGRRMSGAVLATRARCAAPSPMRWPTGARSGCRSAPMVVNDLAWVVFWVIFFHAVATVRGWDADRVLLLLAVLCTSARASSSACCPTAGASAELVADGALDEVLALPVAPLPHLLVRRVDTVNLGDVAFGLVLFAVAGAPDPAAHPVYVAGTLASAVLLTGFLVATGSLVFFTGRRESADLGLNAVLLLAVLPGRRLRGGDEGAALHRGPGRLRQRRACGAGRRLRPQATPP